MNQVAAVDNGSLVESVIAKGDLAKLSPQERTQYYTEVCRSLGLNPLTQPFSYLTLNGKLLLYATRACTDQLRKINNVSVTDMTETERDGVLIVTVKVANADGRTDMSKGAVTLGTLKGDALANQIMKAETKAKRRATLSICGLGFLDELEVETIPQEARRSSNSEKKRTDARGDTSWEQFQHELSECETAFRVEKLRQEYQANIYPTWPKAWPATAEQEFENKLASFSAGEDLEQTLRDSVDTETGEITSAPQTRAQYVQLCHEKIAAFAAVTALLTWWNGEAPARRRFSLSQIEADEMKTRVVVRRRELEAAPHGRDVSGRPMQVTEAG